MTDTEILEDLKKIIHKQFGIAEDKIEEESYFDADLNITDLEIEDLVASLQEKYGMTTTQSTPSFKKVLDLVTYIYENADTTS